MCKMIEFVAPEPSKSFKNKSGASGILQKELRSLRILGKRAPEPQNSLKLTPKHQKNAKRSEATRTRIDPRYPDISRLDAQMGAKAPILLDVRTSISDLEGKS